MQVRIESIICDWAEPIPHIIVRLINVATLSSNEEELRNAVRKVAETTELEKYFAYGYGAHHFWVHQRYLSNGELMKNRLLKIEF